MKALRAFVTLGQFVSIDMQARWAISYLGHLLNLIKIVVQTEKQ
jgi:hypothetical protein